MRRAPALVWLVAVLLAALMLSGPLVGSAVAQEATPTAEEFAPDGVRFDLLGISTATELPGVPADFVLVRFTIEPGAGFPIEEDDPSVALAYVESGALTARVEAPIHVTRAALIAAFTTPGTAEELTGPEEVAAGTEFTLESGDSAFFPPNGEGEIRNDGEEPAVALVAIVAPPEEAAGTPTP
ncbi:MAG: hypothetical protein M3464_13775 [Chloroflexota bacterium]|nr:hypothetical protein [Chloroflexota bacterium]